MSRAASSQDVFHAVADHKRRQMLDGLMDAEMAVGDIAELASLSYSATSQHLAVLLESGLVSRRTEGKRRIYRLETGQLKPIYDWVTQYEKFWRGRLDRLQRHIEENP